MNLAQVVVYLSLAPKSNALYVGYGKASADAQKMLYELVPLQIRNAETNLMKELNYGQGYQYAHDTEEKLTGMSCLPESIKDREYYLPDGQGKEKELKERLSSIKNRRRELQEK